LKEEEESNPIEEESRCRLEVMTASMQSSAVTTPSALVEGEGSIETFDLVVALSRE